MKIDTAAIRFRNQYQKDLNKLYAQLVNKGTSVLVINKTGKRKGFTRSARKKYDYIIAEDALGNVYDIQKMLSMIKRYAWDETRLILNYQNVWWQPFLDLAEVIGLKSKQPRVNWLEKEDIYNLLNLEGWEVIKSGKRYLWPIPMGVVAEYINRYLANLPIINRLCLTNYVVARLVGKPAKNKPSVSIVVPARNEAGNIETVVKKLIHVAQKTELIFVEGHSQDETWAEIIRVQKKYAKHAIKAVKQSGIGKADAVRKGMGLAKNEWLFIWDADLTVSPADFEKFYEAILSGRGEFVFGSRLVYPLESESMRLLNIWGNKFFSWAFSWLLGQPIKDTLCGTKAISRNNYQKLVKNRKYFGDFDPFGDFDLIFGAAKLNLKFAEIPIRYQARTYGQTNISRFSHGWLLFKMVFFALDKLKFV